MIYILGGRGFVGSGFVRLFERLSLPHQVIDRDNYSRMTGSSCDVLINANGNSSKILAARQPMTDFDANVRSARALLTDFKCGFYIHLSSCDVYPDSFGKDSTAEEVVIDTRRQSPYGFHKYLAEECARHLCDKWLILRQGGFVGPGLKKNAVFDILHGDKIWLNLESELQFLHTDDSADLIWALFEKGVTNEIINVCGSGTVSLQKVIEWSGRHVPAEPGSPRVHYEINVNKLASLLDIPNTEKTVRDFVLASL